MEIIARTIFSLVCLIYSYNHNIHQAEPQNQFSRFSMHIGDHSGQVTSLSNATYPVTFVSGGMDATFKVFISLLYFFSRYGVKILAC